MLASKSYEKNSIDCFLSLVKYNAFSQSQFQRIARNVGLLTYSFTDSGKVYTSSGTGTLLFKELDNRKDFGYIFIVTNRHVLPKFNQCKSVDFFIADVDSIKNSYTKITIPVFDANGNYAHNVKVSTDEDLAVIEISSIATNTPILNLPIIPVENFATKAILKNKVYTIGDVVFFIGFPNSFYGGKDYSPIFRTGYISSDPLKKYYFSPQLRKTFKRDSLSGFLIDGNVFAGSSGSLVFTYPTLLDPEFYKEGHELTGIHKANVWVLGVLTESYFTIANNEYSQRINIGAVISGEKVLELINSYTSRNK